MPTRKLYKGQKFNRLTVIEDLPIEKRNAMVLAKCDCGTIKKYRASAIANTYERGTVSCGCYHLEKKTKHGQAVGGKRSRTYATLTAVQQRCCNPNNPDYPEYGGRGITVCETWLGESGLLNFIQDMGERPRELELDRKDPNGNYCKDNCRWADRSTQNHNKRPTGKSGIRGVHQTRSGSFQSYISRNKKHYFLGTFKTASDAQAAYQAKEKELYAE